MNTVIKNPPQPSDIDKWVDEIIESGDREARIKRFIDIVLAVAGEEQMDLAMNACERAYLNTKDFEENFRAFAEFPADQAADISIQSDRRVSVRIAEKQPDWSRGR